MTEGNRGLSLNKVTTRTKLTYLIPKALKSLECDGNGMAEITMQKIGNKIDQINK